MRPRRDFWQARRVGFALRLRFAARCRSWTLHPTRIEAHGRSRGARRSGRRSSPRPRSSSVPSYRPPHDVDLGDSLSPGSGEGQSPCHPVQVTLANVGEKRVRASNQARRAAGPSRSRSIPPRARSTRGLAISFELGLVWLPLDDGLTRHSLPQWIGVMNRSTSNALSRSIMK